MKYEIKVPAMGESISEATIGTIIKATGSNVKMDDEILEIETDKVNQVLYAPQTGILTLTVKPEETVKIGQVIGYVETEALITTSQTAPKEPIEAAKTDTQVAEKKVEIAKEHEREGGARISKEQSLKELQVKPEVTPSENLPNAFSLSSSKLSAPQERRETRKKMSKIRKVIAERLVEAQAESAMLTTFNEVDMTEVLLLREKYKDTFAKEHGVKLGFMSFFVKAVVHALTVVPDINSYIDGDEIVHRDYYDIGIAVGTDKGLVVPVVRNCNLLSFSEIESAIEGFAKKAREGGLLVDDLQNGGFTITNGGVYGSLLSTPILNPPQCGILGMHKIQKRPVVVDDQIVIRPMMYLALSYDHRIVDGKEAVTFLVNVKNMLEDPTRLLLDV